MTSSAIPSSSGPSSKKLEAIIERRIAAGEVDLPVFPAAAQEVINLCDAGKASGDDDESAGVDFKRLATVIKRDATLSAHFLALANSAAFGSRVQLVSIQQALSRLGTERTKQIALVIACKTQAFVVPKRPERAREILRHALGTAIFSQEIARLRRLNVEEAFLAGLLHDIGRPAVMQLCTDVAKEHRELAIDHEGIESCATRLHERVGGMIAQRWSIPQPIARVIERHHTLLSPNDGDKTTAIVQLAGILIRNGAAAPDHEAVALHPAAHVLNLYGEDIDTLLAKKESVEEQLGSMAA